MQHIINHIDQLASLVKWPNHDQNDYVNHHQRKIDETKIREGSFDSDN